MKTGILGGSFDPVHNGHIETALFCKSAFQLDRLMFLPLGDAPHKKKMAPKQIRLQMLEAALEGMEGCCISRLELERAGKTYTYDTVKWLCEHTEGQYFYIIGADTVNTMHTWYRAPEVFATIEFIVAGRAGVDIAQGTARVREMGAKLHFADFVGPDISSTEIKQRIRRGLGIDAMVPPGVLEIIDKYELYRD